MAERVSKCRLPGSGRMTVFFAAVTLPCCGGETGSDVSGHGGGSSATGGGGARATGGARSPGGTPSTAGAASSEGADCLALSDDRGWSVAVVIANQTRSTLHLGQNLVTCGKSPVFSVSDAAGALLLPLSNCRQSCQVAIEGGFQGCPAICLFPDAITLAPGEGMSLQWTGLYTVASSVPKHCLPLTARADSVHCDRAAKIEPGRFTFSARAGTTLDCSQTTGACGTCAQSSVGGCTTHSALIGGVPFYAESEVALDASYGVGDPGGGGATYPVEIVFRDPD